jgi:hypothetical protein
MHMKQKFGSNEDTDLSHKLTFDCQLDIWDPNIKG